MATSSRHTQPQWTPAPPPLLEPPAKRPPVLAPGTRPQVVSFAELEDIRARAFYLWMEAGCPAGDGAEFWMDAEEELREAKRK